MVARVRAALEHGFAPGEISDRGLQVAIAHANLLGVDPIAAALEAATMGASPTWRTRDAGRTLTIAIRKLDKTSAPPAAPTGPGSAGGAASCPGAAAYAAERDAVLAAARPLAGEDFDLWLAKLQVHASGERLVVAVPPQIASWVSDRFTDLLAGAAGRPVDVVACTCAGRPADDVMTRAAQRRSA